MISHARERPAFFNIILKQEVELGLNGGVNDGTSSTGQMSLSGNVGKQQGKFTGSGLSG